MYIITQRGFYDADGVYHPKGFSELDDSYLEPNEFGKSRIPADAAIVGKDHKPINEVEADKLLRKPKGNAPRPADGDFTVKTLQPPAPTSAIKTPAMQPQSGAPVAPKASGPTPVTVEKDNGDKVTSSSNK